MCEALMWFNRGWTPPPTERMIVLYDCTMYILFPTLQEGCGKDCGQDTKPQSAPVDCVSVCEWLSIEIQWGALGRKCCKAPGEQVHTLRGNQISNVRFCKPANKLKLNILSCCNIMFLYILLLFNLSKCSGYRVKHEKTHLIRVRKTSCFGLKHLFWLQQSLSEVSLKNMYSVATHMAAGGPKTVFGLHKLLKNGQKSL